MDSTTQMLLGLPIGLVCLVGGILFMKVCKSIWRIWITAVLVIIGAAVIYAVIQEPLGLPEIHSLMESLLSGLSNQ